MDDDRETLAKAIEWRDAGFETALATVTAAWGSSPRPVGSHLAVRADGVFVGSVSGGCVESAAVSGALDMLNRGEAAAVMDFGVSAWRDGLSCGGKIVVLIQRLGDVEPLRMVLSALERGGSGVVSFGRTDGSMIFAPDAAAAETTGGDRFIRLYRPVPRLAIAGAVHIAEHLARMAGATGFHTTVFDPRRGFAERGAFDRVPFVGWPDDYFQEHPIDERTAVVSLTHVGRIDHPTMTAALRSPAFYVGALGGKVTHAKRLTRLAGEGFDDVSLQRVHGPVGLPIGARSPAEIAVSILAQLIGAWRSRDERT